MKAKVFTMQVFAMQFPHGNLKFKAGPLWLTGDTRSYRQDLLFFGIISVGWIYVLLDYVSQMQT